MKATLLKMSLICASLRTACAFAAEAPEISRRLFLAGSATAVASNLVPCGRGGQTAASLHEPQILWGPKGKDLFLTDAYGNLHRAPVVRQIAVFGEKFVEAAAKPVELEPYQLELRMPLSPIAAKVNTVLESFVSCDTQLTEASALPPYDAGDLGPPEER